MNQQLLLRRTHLVNLDLDRMFDMRAHSFQPFLPITERGNLAPSFDGRLICGRMQSALDCFQKIIRLILRDKQDVVLLVEFTDRRQAR